MAVFGSLSTVRDQLAPSLAFATALEYVERCLTPGSEENRRILAVAVDATERVELAGGVFALEQAYVGKPAETGKWEAHKAYIDIQVVVAGNELMEVTDVRELTVAEDLTPERDLLFYAPFDGGSLLRAGTGFVAVFFPIDAHKPSLSAGDGGVIRKTVVKVPVRA